MKNFYFRKFTLEDIDSLYQAILGEEVAKHMATRGFSREDCQWIIEDSIKSWEERDFGTWAVIDSESNTLFGWAGFKPWRDNEIELLAVLHPSSRGMGLKVVDELLRIGFNDLKLNELYILLPASRRSFSFVQSKGFEDCGEEIFEGECFRKFVIKKGLSPKGQP